MNKRHTYSYSNLERSGGLIEWPARLEKHPKGQIASVRVQLIVLELVGHEKEQVGLVVGRELVKASELERVRHAVHVSHVLRVAIGHLPRLDLFVEGGRDPLVE